MSTLIVRHSKYDFWIPDEILTLEKTTIIFFRCRKWKQSDRFFFGIKQKTQKNDFSKKTIFSIFGSDPKIFWSEKKLKIKIFDLRKKMFEFQKLCPRIWWR